MNINIEMPGNRGTVGGVATDIRSVCRGEGLGRTQDGGLVAPRGNGDATLGNLGRSLMGSKK